MPSRRHQNKPKITVGIEAIRKRNCNIFHFLILKYRCQIATKSFKSDFWFKVRKFLV